MNTTLFNQVSQVNAICQQALPYVENANNLRAQAEKQVVRKVGFVWAGIGIGVGCMYAVSGIGSLLFSQPGMEALGSIIMFIGIAIGVIGGIFSFKVLYNTKKAKADAARMSLNRQADEQMAIVQRIFDENVEITSILPNQYVHPEATAYITAMVQSGRANTIPEALALYDEYEHRCNMENAQMEMLQQQQAQTAYLRSIKTTNAINMGANIANAAANISRIF